MCGLAGYLNVIPRESETHAKAIARQMADALLHRGPDDRGEWANEREGVAFGFRRLSIIDLSAAGHQPMTSASGRYVLAFNGEIYNFNDLRKEIIAQDPSACFRGSSDTEVMLAAFERWGVEPSLRRFNGMFAFALFDQVERRLLLARDRAGEKPLYYGWCGDTLLFGSELKALQAHPRFSAGIDSGALSLMIKYAYVPAPYSIFENIHKLPAGCCISFAAGDRQTPAPRPYWSLRDCLEKTSAPRDDHAETVAELHRLLLDAVNIRMMADVPVGAFLSGGIDSSLICALMQANSRSPVHTFTIGFEESRFDEARFAKTVATHLGTDHNELYVTPQDALDVIPALPRIYDEPFADSSQIPTYLISKLARGKVTVALTGDGGDEVFAGYHRHFFMKKLGRVGSVPYILRKALAAGVTAVPISTWDSWLANSQRFSSSLRSDFVNGERLHKAANVISQRSNIEMLDLITSHWSSSSHLVKTAGQYRSAISTPESWPMLPYAEQVVFIDTITYLPDDILVKVDRASMASSLEGRMPFLDHRVMEFSWQIPFSMRLRGGIGKWILREILDIYVPRSFVERPKSGFAVPLEKWLRHDLRDWAEGLLDQTRLRQEGFFVPDEIRRIWEAFIAGYPNLQSRIWNILMFQAWLEEQGKRPVHAQPATVPQECPAQ